MKQPDKAFFIKLYQSTLQATDANDFFDYIVNLCEKELTEEEIKKCKQEAEEYLRI